MKHSLLVFSLLLGIFASAFSQDFYDISTINTIELTFEESNWDALLDAYYADDNDQKLMGTALVNGVKFDSVGVKYKGNSTYSARNAKNPLHIYLDYIINQDYEGYESIKLSNGYKDPSFVREVLSYEIARKYMKAPLSNYAKVYINGSYYGLFSSSEAINGDFTDRRIFADNDNTRIKCNPLNTNDGNGPSLEYLGVDSSAYFNYYEVKSDYGWKDLIELTYDIEFNASEIEEILDIDHAIWLLAFNNVTVNLDSYTGPFRQNYYLIKDDNGRFVPVIWDLNESLGAFSTINSGGQGPIAAPPPGGGSATNLDELDLFLREGDDTYPLLKMIFDNERYKKMYVAHCKTILSENFTSGWYAAKADTLQDLISSDLSSDPNAFYTSTQFRGNLSGTQDGVIGITELMSPRINYLQNLTEFNYAAPEIINISQPDEITPFSEITVTAEISNTNYVYLAYRHSKDEAFTKIEMFDDGLHDDGASSDGVYGVSFDVDESNTHYYIYAENSDAGIFSPEAAEHEFYKITAEANEDISFDVVVNELLASNSSAGSDSFEEFDDWVELYNNTDSDISLAGYYLTDDNTDIMQWAFPDTVIEANSYLIVWADKDEEQGALHTNFKLSASGEGVYLVDSDLNIVNAIEYETQWTDLSYSRNPNGTGDFLVQGPTFEFNNEETSLLNEDIDFSELEDDETTDIDVEEDIEFKIYPVPASDKLFVTVKDEQFSVKEITVLNTMGQVCLKEGVYQQNEVELDISSLRSGLYILCVESSLGLHTRKFVKE